MNLEKLNAENTDKVRATTQPASQPFFKQFASPITGYAESSLDPTWDSNAYGQLTDYGTC
ncbi:hypothetical protein A3B05_00670 [Candidatus Giovannonibacteria bacterium RIFCSPLOWO2_01_FULL_43_160]|uniref:Uncharacterized protein n=2 Tax=Candidatus Giovannoniibacteriota TaxID=1752738 RepID=A0A0G1ITW9_9BACT|nr:MAG: hypothetical protein UV72_C0011G0018 [Candidatus Giovannonibacteria bacterium GW2011_GWB1_43_13]KKS99097.1 MAG: hypothetical protein UV75_C0010G0018 [Candidatus Giovannonibacteria bacterium GW2011_GWA1_43_15]KKT62786.1 MAG: hypothetical protein UW55_C0009G0017 [Candidatus Giovannonibacteria bacterium GW2011_GWA2_44_26]OGF59062.1 MAG: hypothetical protein A2652_03010 [Candidatus Giovannonibacteria bacterium RIFCSPHIGHO2_01_FULL_43_140]OGF74936.1 MAG: hypothetical protein A3B05_00670 [Can